MGHPRHKERANRARAMAAQGITLPATGLKRVREDDLSDSFGKVKLEDASEFRPSKQSKVTSSVSLEVKATEPVIPKVEVSPGLVQVQASTSQPPPAGPAITLKFEGEGAHIANRDRLRKAYWTEKPVFSGTLSSFLFFRIFISFHTTTASVIKIIWGSLHLYPLCCWLVTCLILFVTTVSSLISPTSTLQHQIL